MIIKSTLLFRPDKNKKYTVTYVLRRQFDKDVSGVIRQVR